MYGMNEDQAETMLFGRWTLSKAGVPLQISDHSNMPAQNFIHEVPRSRNRRYTSKKIEKRSDRRSSYSIAAAEFRSLLDLNNVL
jgi:ribosomal protein S30